MEGSAATFATERYTAALRESSYEGWVAYVNGEPIFERVSVHPLDIPENVIGGTRPPVRDGRQFAEWDELQTEAFRRRVGQVHRVEVYFGRQVARMSQPAIWYACNPGDRVRFIQFKRRARLANAGGLDSPHARTGVLSYSLGYWDRATNECRLFECDPQHPAVVFCPLCRLGAHECACLPIRNPCWPRPQGFGLSPHVLGLTPREAGLEAAPA